MELRFKGQFNRDIDISNRKILEEVRDCILNVKAAKSISQIANFKKLRIYKITVLKLQNTTALAL